MKTTIDFDSSEEDIDGQFKLDVSQFGKDMDAFDSFLSDISPAPKAPLRPGVRVVTAAIDLLDDDESLYSSGSEDEFGQDFKPQRAEPAGALEEIFQKSLRKAEDLATKFKRNIKVEDRLHELKMYKQCFVAEEAVDYFVESGAARDRKDAVECGRSLQKAGIFDHVNGQHEFKDSYSLFRFNKGTGRLSVKKADESIDPIKTGTEDGRSSPSSAQRLSAGSDHQKSTKKDELSNSEHTGRGRRRISKSELNASAQRFGLGGSDHQMSAKKDELSKSEHNGRSRRLTSKSELNSSARFFIAGGDHQKRTSKDDLSKSEHGGRSRRRISRSENKNQLCKSLSPVPPGGERRRIRSDFGDKERLACLSPPLRDSESSVRERRTSLSPPRTSRRGIDAKPSRRRKDELSQSEHCKPRLRRDNLYTQATEPDRSRGSRRIASTSDFEVAAGGRRQAFTRSQSFGGRRRRRRSRSTEHERSPEGEGRLEESGRRRDSSIEENREENRRRRTSASEATDKEQSNHRRSSRSSEEGGRKRGSSAETGARSDQGRSRRMSDSKARRSGDPLSAGSSHETRRERRRSPSSPSKTSPRLRSKSASKRVPVTVPSSEESRRRRDSSIEENRLRRSSSSEAIDKEQSNHRRSSRSSEEGHRRRGSSAETSRSEQGRARRISDSKARRASDALNATACHETSLSHETVSYGTYGTAQLKA